MNLLETTKLVKTYSGRTVVNNVSFILHPEEIVGILGRNGAGKTTTFRMIMGMIKPDAGAVAFDGQDITHLPMYKRALRGMGYLSQERSDFRRLTVWQNLQVVLETMPLSRSERNQRANTLLEQYDLLRLKGQLADTLSGGERRKLEICRALCRRPKLILLDEPFTGVDPLAVEDLQREIKRLRDDWRISVLITEHKVQEALRICNRAIIIVDGEKIMEGTPREVITSDRVKQAYLGNMFRGDEFDESSSGVTTARPDAAAEPRAARRTTIETSEIQQCPSCHGRVRDGSDGYFRSFDIAFRCGCGGTVRADGKAVCRSLGLTAKHADCGAAAYIPATVWCSLCAQNFIAGWESLVVRHRAEEAAARTAEEAEASGGQRPRQLFEPPADAQRLTPPILECPCDHCGRADWWTPDGHRAVHEQDLRQGVLRCFDCGRWAVCRFN